MLGKRSVVGLVVAVIVLAAVLAGCGGSRHLTTGTLADSRFVGRTACATCHSDIDAEYTLQAHGQDFLTAHGRDLVYGSNGGCAPCHSVGWQEPTGFQVDHSTTYLEGIGCEECHGPGGDHVSSPSSSNINGLPSAEDTCWDCHVRSYKQLDTPESTTVTDATLYSRNPGSVSASHPQALLLLGLYGYQHPEDPGPHALVDNTCVSCHLNPVQSASSLGLRNASSIDHGEDALEPDLTTCAQCHGSEQAAKTLFEELEEEIIDQLIELGGEDPAAPGQPDGSCRGGLLNAYAVQHGIVLTSNLTPDDPYVKSYKAARHNYKFVLQDASKGAHNPEFAEALLEEARNRLGS